MTPQERDLISDLFTRMRAIPAESRDGEAEALIRQAVATQPGAPYLLVQTVLVQDQALAAAQARIEDLQRQLAAAQTRAQTQGQTPAHPAGASSFLGSYRRPAPAELPPGPQPGPWAPPPQPGPWGAPRAGGFLQSAMTTAVGVAGGALLFEGIQHLLGSNPGPLAQTTAAPTEVVENTTVNTYYGDQSSDSGGDDFSDDV